MYQFGICGMGHNGFMNQIMTSQAAADEIIQQLKIEIDEDRDPNILLNTLDLSMIIDTDLKRIKTEVERYGNGY